MRALLALLAGATLLAGAARAQERPSPVGLQQLEFADGPRTLALTLYYPAASGADSRRFVMPYFTNLDLLDGAPPDTTQGRRPLVLFSHGRGSNALTYAWFGQYLAARGTVVAALDHYRANSYDSTIAYLANRLWQRPVDLSLALNHLLAQPRWGALIDAGRVGVAGHSQGGFTALWIGGAQVNAEKFVAFQRGWKNNRLVPEHLRRELPIDAAPALAVHDARIKAAFAMAPGIVQAFGMDAAGLARMAIPAYLTVGARDTQTPAGPNAEFAARHIPRAELAVIQGEVDHEIFVNQCDQEGRDEFPEACIDAAGVDRGAIHGAVGAAAAGFFGRWLGPPR